MSFAFEPDERHALFLDERDALARYRARFRQPQGPPGAAPLYFAGNSLGLQPLGVAEALSEELEAWASHAVDAHFRGRTPWVSYHEVLREPLGRLVGAAPSEVVAMNGLTVNLHLMLVSFYRPTATRYKILMEDCAFPSDTYAVRSQIAWRGHDPDEGLIVAAPRAGESTIRSEDLLELIERRAGEIALVLLGGVNYFTGQRFDMERITAVARGRGVTVGFDLAHAVGNVPLALHDWQVDFAVWCSYKYLNAGPGAVAGCFVHDRHARDGAVPRLAGWWGHNPASRFRMHLERRFEAEPGADGWQLSNPPILAMAPLRVSLAIFDEVGIEALAAKSRTLTAYLQYQVQRAAGAGIEVVTPEDPAARGCQLSLRVRERPEETFHQLVARGVVGDFRPPDVIRVAPVPLYNTFHEVWHFGRLLDGRL